MLKYEVFSQRLSAQRSVATAKCAEMTLDTGIEEHQDAFNPAELMLAALSAGMLKGIERVAPTLNFGFRDAAIRVHGWCQDSPPRMIKIEYTLWVDTDETDQRLELLHDNLKKFGIIFNTMAAGCELAGGIHHGRPI